VKEGRGTNDGVQLSKEDASLDDDDSGDGGGGGGWYVKELRLPVCP
jgi:hypothetical protein